MAKSVPPRKSFRSKIYSHIQNVDSHIDNVRNSLENLVFSNEKETERLIFKKRLKVAAFVTVFLMAVGYFISPKGKAEIVTFYPSACLGGWVNPGNAEGEPQTKSNDDESAFTKDNSAILPSTTHAEIYCGNFTGEIAENTKPIKILVTLAWSKGADVATTTQQITGTSFASSTGAILDSTSSTDVSFTLSSTTASSSTSASSSSTTASSTGGTSIVNQVINAVADTIGKLFGGDTSSSTSSQNPTTTPVTPTSPSTVSTSTPPPASAPAPAPALDATPTPSAPSPAPAPAPAPTPTAQGTTTSFLETSLEKLAAYFIKHAFAQETSSSSDSTTSTQTTPNNSATATTVTTTTPELPGTVPVDATPTSTSQAATDGTSSNDSIYNEMSSSTQNAASTTEGTDTDQLASSTPAVAMDSSSDDQSGNNFLEVLYSFDGNVWNSLGKVNESSMKYRTFEIPVTATTSWGDLSQLQIKVQSIPRIDATPAVYLDGIKVDVLYETPVLHNHPDFTRDTILKDKSDDGVRIVNIINGDTNANEIWYTTIDSQGEYGVAPGSWVQAKLDQPSSSYKLIDIYGQNIFWVDEGAKMLWDMNLEKQSNDGIGLVPNGSTTVTFTKVNGEEWIFEYNDATKESVARIKN